jgi:hypothetical protein
VPVQWVDDDRGSLRSASALAEVEPETAEADFIVRIPNFLDP